MPSRAADKPLIKQHSLQLSHRRSANAAARGSLNLPAKHHHVIQRLLSSSAAISGELVTTVNASSAGSASAIARLVVLGIDKMQPPGLTSLAHFCAILILLLHFVFPLAVIPGFRQVHYRAAVHLLQTPSLLSSCRSRRIVCSETFKRLASSLQTTRPFSPEDLTNQRLSLLRESCIIEHINS